MQVKKDKYIESWAWYRENTTRFFAFFPSRKTEAPAAEAKALGTSFAPKDGFAVRANKQGTERVFTFGPRNPTITSRSKVGGRGQGFGAAVVFGIVIPLAVYFSVRSDQKKIDESRKEGHRDYL